MDVCACFPKSVNINDYRNGLIYITNLIDKRLNKQWFMPPDYCLCQQLNLTCRIILLRNLHCSLNQDLLVFISIS